MKRILLPLIVLVACHEQPSKLDHTPGELGRDIGVAYQPCSEKVDPNNAMQSALVPYLRDMARIIMERVNASLVDDSLAPLFAGHLAPENFCFAAPPEVGSQLNAYADGLNRTITVLPSVIKTLRNEAAIAAVMCHELAHITMSNGQVKGLRPDAMALLKKRPQFESELKRSSDICDNSLINDRPSPELIDKLYPENIELQAAYRQLNLSYTGYFNAHFFDMIFGKRGDLGDQIFICSNKAKAFALLNSVAPSPALLAGMSPDERLSWDLWQVEGLGEEDPRAVRDAYAFFSAIAAELDVFHHAGSDAYLNWYEQEADEVGYEMCLRAGVDQSTFMAFHELLLKSDSPQSYASCMAAINAGEAIERGSGTHPETCWRLYDILQREEGTHASEYQRIRSKTLPRDLLPPERLSDVLSLIEKN